MAQVYKLLMHFGCRSAVGLKIQISWEYLVVELGVTVQLLQVSFRKNWFLATDCWLKSLWEKVTEYGIHVEVDTVRLAPPQRGDTWFMALIIALPYTQEEILCNNRMRLHQQVIYLSDILDAQETAIDRQYLMLQPADARLLSYFFLMEGPAPWDFRLWQQAVFQVKVEWRAWESIGPFLQQTHNIWEW